MPLRTLPALTALSVALALSGCSSHDTSVHNDTDRPVRLSGCDIGEALNLKPGAVGTVSGVANPERCNAYDGETYKRIGCLVFQAGIPARVSTVDRTISEADCNR